MKRYFGTNASPVFGLICEMDRMHAARMHIQARIGNRKSEDGMKNEEAEG